MANGIFNPVLVRLVWLALLSMQRHVFIAASANLLFMAFFGRRSVSSSKLMRQEFMWVEALCEGGRWWQSLVYGADSIACEEAWKKSRGVLQA